LHGCFGGFGPIERRRTEKKVELLEFVRCLKIYGTSRIFISSKRNINVKDTSLGRFEVGVED
jgi:hypothetical protein